MLGGLSPIPYLYYITKRYNMNHLILSNFKEVSDEMIMEAFTYEAGNTNTVWMWNGFFWRTKDESDNEIKSDKRIDGYIYKMLEKISKK